MPTSVAVEERHIKHFAGRTFVLLRVSVQPAECALVTLWASSSQRPLSGLSASAAPTPHSSFHTTCHPLPNSTHIHSSFSTLLEQTYVYARPRATKNFVPVPCFHRTSVNCSTAICREKLFRLMGNDVEHSPWEDDGFSASQETARILLNPKVY